MILSVTNQNKLNEYNNLYRNNNLKGLYIYKVYSESCFYCTLMQDEWNKLKNDEIINDISLVEIESDFKNSIENKMISDVYRYPTIFISYNNQPPIVFEEERLCKNFLSFIKNNLKKYTKRGGVSKTKRKKNKSKKSVKKSQK